MTLARSALFLLAALTVAVPSVPAQGRPAGDKLVFIVRHAEKANATDADPPLATALEVTSHVVSFGSGAVEHAALVAKAVAEQRGGAVLVVGHSNTVNAIIAALGGPRLPELCDAAYAKPVHRPVAGERAADPRAHAVRRRGPRRVGDVRRHDRALTRW